MALGVYIGYIKVNISMLVKCVFTNVYSDNPSARNTLVIFHTTVGNDDGHIQHLTSGTRDSKQRQYRVPLHYSAHQDSNLCLSKVVEEV